MKSQRSYLSNRKVYNSWIKYVVLCMCTLSSIALIFIYFYSHSLIDQISLNEPILVTNIAEMSKFQGRKYVHLDLKGAPPKISYYRYLFSLFVNEGVTGILMEYEDMFPYQGIRLNNISALNAYTVNDIRLINSLADANGLEIIPFVQTFGEIEFVLKLEEFKHLREIPEFPEVLCPTNKESLDVMIEMVSQVIVAHPNIKTIHLGGATTQYFGICKECTKQIHSLNISREDLYLKHIKKISDIVKEKYPHVSILIWDDQLRYFLDEEMQNNFYDFPIIPVIKQYDSDVFDKLGSSLWNQYAKFFNKVWIASAFKGVTGVDQYIVNVAHYIQNHRSWMSVIENYKYSVNFEAIIITGFQRYNHFSVLCELLPVALPSLFMNLEILKFKEKNHLEASKEVAKIFKCQQPYALIGTSFGTPRCSFPGSEILENVYRLYQLKEDFNQLTKSSEVRGWMNSFNSYYNFSSPQHIMRISAHLNHFEREINEIENDISQALLDVYDVFTKNEWIFTHIKPLKKHILELQEIKTRCLTKNIWPRRPFNNEIF